MYPWKRSRRSDESDGPVVQYLGLRSAAVAGGLALGLSFPPYPFPFLAWAAFVPLLIRWNQTASWRSIFLDAFLFFLAAFAVAFSWPLLHVLPHAALASLNGVLGLPLVLALPFAASVWVRWHVGRAAGLAALLAFYLVVELGLSRGPLAFPWPLLGHTLSEALLLNQFADVTGVPGLTLWVLIVNVAVFSLLSSAGHRPRFARAAALFVLLAAPFLYSLWRLETIPPHGTTLRTGLVQPGTDPLIWSGVRDTTRLRTLQSLTGSLLRRHGDLDLIIWPETALPLYDGAVQALDPASYPRLESWIREHEIPLLTGAVTRADSSSYYNTALLFNPGRTVQRYDKRYLVPFAEHVPFVEQWPALKRLAIPAGGVSGYRAGREQHLFQTSGAAFGVLICLESAFGDYARRSVQQGADFLITITQDGWWGRSPGYRQHLAFTRLRAIETRRAVVQVSVTGTTALVLPDGRIPLQTGWMERTALAAEIPIFNGYTFYTRHGDWLSYVACIAAIFLLIIAALSTSWHGRSKHLHTKDDEARSVLT